MTAGDTAAGSTQAGDPAGGADATGGGASTASMDDGDRPDRWQPPETFDEYRLVRPIGAGAMGEVYLAEDLLLAREVAVKFVRAGEGASTAASERFYVEARAIARLSHPHVVAVYRVGRVRRRPYLVSEYVAGRSLDRLALPLPAARVIEIGAALASGLAAAHRRGVLHRDLKPANAIVSDAGDVKLLDFGLAKLLDEPDAAAAATRGGLDGIDPAATGGAAARTRPGAMVGSPLYMAPELWRGEPATVATDLYALGVLLHELCAGRPPRADRTIDQLRREVVDEDVPALASVAPDVPPALAAIVDRLVRRDPAARFASADAVRTALEGLRRDAGTARADAVDDARALDADGPYRGLHPFGPEHRARFFGREREARAVIDRLRVEPFVLVAGDSGVGKSSLCAAGVLPRIGALDGARAWTPVSLVPGRRPVASLARALAPVLNVEEDALAARLAAEPGAIDRELRRALGAARGLVVYVDQLEELVTASEPVEAAAAAEALGAIAQRAPGLRLLATGRSDFLTRLVTLPRLGADVAAALYLLPPLDDDGVRDAIVGPARAAGVSFESEALVSELAAAAGGGLPLLQFTLAALWDARERDRVPAAALAALGGVGGALARHADGVIERLLPDERAAARRVLSRLVTAEGTRARRAAGELDPSPAGRRALEALVRGRLVVAREDETYELAHEVLLTAWGTLRAWLGGDLERRAARERLERAAREWDRLGRPADALWGPRQLAELDAIAAIDGGSIEDAPLDRAFAAASRRAQRRRRLARRAILAGVVAAGALVYGGVRWQAARDRDRRVDAQVAIAERALARHARDWTRPEPIVGRAFALFDELERGREPAEAEAAWAEARQLAADLDAQHAIAERAYEHALSIDPSRTDVRARFASLLSTRAYLAELRHDRAARDAYLARMTVHDRDGKLGRRWAAPAEVRFTTDPPGATVDAARYGDDPRRTLGPPRRLGTTPLPRVALAPGSYLVTLTAPGRPPVRYPVLLARGEDFHATVPIPAAIPDGFVYVPAGRFLYGSADVEEIRASFFYAQPIHEVRAGAFLIARHEVTFAEWIAYLDTLAPDEQARRTPRGGNEQGMVRLEPIAIAAPVPSPASRWRLTFDGDGGHVVTATDAEPLVYPGRTIRASQDWRRFPVTGISWDDVVAYAAWLDETGRVPGARPCDEREWERAARGADARRYPHGDVLAPDDADHDVTYGRTPGAYGLDEVGSYPASDSPFGVADLVGNAFEWVRSVQRPPAQGEVIFRSASFYRDAISNAIVNRNFGTAALRTNQLGARICADLRDPEAP